MVKLRLYFEENWFFLVISNMKQEMCKHVVSVQLKLKEKCIYFTYLYRFAFCSTVHLYLCRWTQVSIWICDYMICGSSIFWQVVVSWTDCRLPTWVCLARPKSFSSLLRHQGCCDAHRFKCQADIPNHIFPVSLSAWTAWEVLRRSQWWVSRCSIEIQGDDIYSGCSADSEVAIFILN